MSTITSTASGFWSVGGTWVGGIPPTVGDLVIIAAGHVVDVDQNITVGSDAASNVAITINGTMRVNNPAASYTTTTYGFCDVKSGGEYKIDMSSQPSFIYTHKVNASATLSKSEWYIRVNNGGKLTITGANKTRSQDTTSITSNSGTNTITTTSDNSSGWLAGDKLKIFTKGASAGGEEEVTILSFSTNTITLTGNLTNTHASGSYVLNMTRNVYFTTFSGLSSATSILINPQSTAANNANINVSWAEFEGGSDSNFNHAAVYHAGTGLGTWDSCAFYNTTNNGLSLDASMTAGTLSNCVFSWKSGATSFGHRICNSNMTGLTFTNNSFCGAKTSIYLNAGGFDQCTFTGEVVVGAAWNTNNSTAQFFTNSTLTNLTLIGSQLALAASFNNTITGLYTGNCTTAISLVNGSSQNIFTTTTFSGNTTDISPNNYTDNYFYDISNTPTVTLGASMINGSRLRLEKLVNTEGTHKTYTRAGNYTKQSSTVRSGTYALQMNPTSSTLQLIAKAAIPAKSGVQAAVTAWVRKNSTYGSSNLPFIRLSGLGITTSTATMTDVNDTFQLLVISGTPTVDGFLLFEIVAQSAGASAAVFADDVITVSTAIDTGTFDFWYQGDMPPVILSTGLGALDVWNVQTSQITTTSSTTGKKLIDDLITDDFIALK